MTSEQEKYHNHLPPKSPRVSRKKFMSSHSLPRSRSSSLSNILSCSLEKILDPEICDSCACEEVDTRFTTSMVAHQLPNLDYQEECQDLLLASLVSHMVCKLLGDEESLKEKYMNFVENFVYADDQASGCRHYNFLPSFLSHCLPLLDQNTDPALSHLITTLVSHTTASSYSEGYDLDDVKENNNFAQVNQNFNVSAENDEVSDHESSTSTSDMFPHQLLSVSSLNTESTPESLHSLEQVSFTGRHLLSGLSPGRLDKQFSESQQYSSSDSDQEGEWWTGEDAEEEEVFDDDDDDDDDVFIKEEFETRELSIVLEETEDESDTSADDIVDKVVTGLCILNDDSGVKIETHVDTVKKKTKKKVTFSKEEPQTFSRIPSVETPSPELKPTPQDLQDVENESKNMSCKKCKQEKILNIRLSYILGSDKLKAKNSIFRMVLGWFEKFL